MVSSPAGRGRFWPFSPLFKWAAKKGQKRPKAAKRCQKVPKAAKWLTRPIADLRSPTSDLRQVEEALPPKSKIGKEKVKFWMLYQQLTTNDPATGKETGKGGKGLGTAAAGGQGREVESGNWPRAGSLDFGASFLPRRPVDAPRPRHAVHRPPSTVHRFQLSAFPISAFQVGSAPLPLRAFAFRPSDFRPPSSDLRAFILPAAGARRFRGGAWGGRGRRRCRRG